ncbi:hypothetical protein [Streptomyces sp. ODS28]|uniref:phage late control D family protein n=1 Tax=Streptomyces sp. ODS28 TaxID=3136688 RepID=UPI0031F164C6
MQHDHVRIAFDGAEIPGFYEDLLTLEVELDEELAGMFRMTVKLLLHADGSWTYLDDDPFGLWHRVDIEAGLADDARPLLTGYITHLRPDFGAGLGSARLDIWGMDASVLMDRADRLVAWPDKRDSDIATELFRAYELTPWVTDTAVVHGQDVSTVIQRETDMRLLRRLALRNGYECFVDGDTGHFHPPAVDAPPQPALAAYAREETTLNRFRLEINALTSENVAMAQFDHISGQLLESAVESGSEPAYGAKTAEALLGPGVEPALTRVGQTVTTGLEEMDALCQGLFDQGQWFVTGEGEVAANAYGNVLKARDPVTIKGLGETHSGVYYVTHVTHRFGRDGYRQQVKVKRNALLPTGREDFSSGDGGLIAAAAAGVLVVETGLG